MEKFKLEVLGIGKEFEDYSPLYGEMSEGQRGQVPVRETLFQKGSSSINSHKYSSMRITHTLSGRFVSACKKLLKALGFT